MSSFLAALALSAFLSARMSLPSAVLPFSFKTAFLASSTVIPFVLPSAILTSRPCTCRRKTKDFAPALVTRTASPSTFSSEWKPSPASFATRMSVNATFFVGVRFRVCFGNVSNSHGDSEALSSRARRSGLVDGTSQNHSGGGGGDATSGFFVPSVLFRKFSSRVLIRPISNGRPDRTDEHAMQEMMKANSPPSAA